MKAKKNSSKRDRKPMICMVTDGSPMMGMGHVQQSITLARYLSGEVDIAFLTKSDEIVISAIRDSGFHVTSLRNDEEVYSALKDRSPDAILFDKTDVSPDLAARIRGHIACRLIILTNLTTANDSAHIVVLQRAPDLTVSPVERFRNLSFKDSVTGARYFYGPKYWVLRPEFFEMKKRGKSVSRRPERILLSFGGSDPGNLTLIVLEELLKEPEEYLIDIILGSQFRSGDAVEKLLDKFQHRRGDVTLHWNTKAVAQLMYRADLAITAAGISMFEALCVGTPVIVFPQDQLQRETYRGVMRLVEVDELDSIGEIIRQSDFSLPQDEIIARMEIGEGLNHLIDAILDR